tara:strand:+ start:1327 stop:1572 length:246 start_codon:yes stop_codon:yes gene_type:complete
MTPQENIYRSDEDVVDGLVDVEQFAEDFTNDSIDTLRDMMEDDQYDDGQPDMDQEYADLYGYGDEYDCVNDIFDYSEDWGV